MINLIEIQGRKTIKIDHQNFKPEKETKFRERKPIIDMFGLEIQGRKTTLLSINTTMIHISTFPTFFFNIFDS